jgi:hypothetical protein
MEQHSTKGNRTSSCSTGIDPLSGLDDNRRIHNKHHCGRWYACCKLMEPGGELCGRARECPYRQRLSGRAYGTIREQAALCAVYM